MNVMIALLEYLNLAYRLGKKKSCTHLHKFAIYGNCICMNFVFANSNRLDWALLATNNSSKVS